MIRSLVKPQNDLASIPGRLDGKTCLVTGANSGLGKEIAVELARRGAYVIMGCRRMCTEALEEIKERSESIQISLRIVDLAEINSVVQFCNNLREDGVKLDVLMCNAGIASSGNKMSRDGFTLLLQVNFLSYALMIKTLLNNIVIQDPKEEGSIPRIIFTSSSRHRGPLSIDFDHFGEFPDYSILDIFRYYGVSKLYLMTYAWELGRRLQERGKPSASVFAFCPGSFRSKIGKNIGVLGNLVMSTRLTSARKAAWPAVYLACAPELENQTLVYYHKREQESPDFRATNPINGKMLWEKTEELLARVRKQD
jgi:NAD(P)-dependent dehydrogenase (short-subunit alcohol dehydrogenase family)